MAIDQKSFGTYLASVLDQRPEFADLKAILDGNRAEAENFSQAPWTGDIYIHDKIADSGVQSRHFQAGNNSDLTVLKDALRILPTHLKHRDVLIDLDDQRRIDQRVLETLRLHCHVSMLFFWSSLTRRFWSPPRSRGLLRMSYMTLELMKGWPSSAELVPGALIAFHDAEIPWKARPWKLHTFESFWFTIHEHPNCPNHSERLNHFHRSWNHPERFSIMQVFDELVLNHPPSLSLEDHLFHLLMTLATIHLAIFRQIWSNHWIYETGEADPEDWLAFRTELDAYQDDIRAFSQYAARYAKVSAFQERYDEIREDQENLLLEGRALETYLRDTFNASVGTTSLQESRRSIEEGKRVKLLTILAFVFIPTTLIASIFGMNVQQINGTGHNIWVFAVTALVMTGIAFTAWLLSFQMQAWRQLRQQRQPQSRDSLEQGQGLGLGVQDRRGKSDRKLRRLGTLIRRTRAVSGLDSPVLRDEEAGNRVEGEGAVDEEGTRSAEREKTDGRAYEKFNQGKRKGMGLGRPGNPVGF